ncbi:uncharacterized protein [Eurosta solidaginis]|uniref:uncharacterized protein n=1 Tax=Eurosta solidaginis TaxID=178769 RepID=UPI0035316E87
MWEELASYRNHFLQLEVDNMKKETLNNFVKTEFQQKQKRRCKCVCPNDDDCESSTYFRDHASLAYGFICMEKLMEKMCSDDPLEKWQNVNSLSEVLLNPWQAQRAITEYGVVKKCKNMFLRIQLGSHKENYHETRQLMKIFYLISNYLNGAKQIVSHVSLIDEFYAIIYNRESTYLTACKILRNLTEKTEVLLHLLENTQAFRKLAKIFSADPCTPFYPNPLWEHLCHFLEIDPKLGINYGYFELLVERIQSRRLFYHQICMKCFAMLLRCAEGEQLFDKVDGIKMLYNIIADDAKKLDNYEFVILALMHGLVSKFALWRCREFTDLPKRIITLAKCENKNLQLECLKVLRLMSAMPCVKDYIKSGCMSEIMSIKCLNEQNECIRDSLAEWLNREICDSSEM